MLIQWCLKLAAKWRDVRLIVCVVSVHFVKIQGRVCGRHSHLLLFTPSNLGGERDTGREEYSLFLPWLQETVDFSTGVTIMDIEK